MYDILSIYSILMKTYSYFHILPRSVPRPVHRSVKIGIWQAHWLDPVGINLYSKDYQSIPKFSRVMSISANCLGQGKVTFGNSFVWILSVLMRIQNCIKIIPYG